MLHRTVLCVDKACRTSHGIASLGDEMGNFICQKRIAFLFSIRIIADAAAPCFVHHLRELSKVVVGIISRGGGSSAIYNSIGCLLVQSTGKLVGMSFHITSGIRLRCEAVVVVVCLRYSSTVGVSLALLQPCVSRLKLIDSVRVNEKMFDESGIV